MWATYIREWVGNNEFKPYLKKQLSVGLNLGEQISICHSSINWPFIFIIVSLEQYIGKMLEIKEVMDNILAQQKTERDDLAKKYRWVGKRTYPFELLKCQGLGLKCSPKAHVLKA